MLKMRRMLNMRNVNHFRNYAAPVHRCTAASLHHRHVCRGTNANHWQCHSHWQQAINHQLLKRCLARTSSNNKLTFQRRPPPSHLPRSLIASHSFICVPPAAPAVAAAATATATATAATHVGRFKAFSCMTYFKRSANSCNSNTNQSWQQQAVNNRYLEMAHLKSHSAFVNGKLISI